MKTKRLLALILSVCMIFTVMPGISLTAIAATEGTVNDTITWSLDDEGTLTISGSGAIPDYDSGAAPWDESKSSIKKIVIEEGITAIGDFAFYYCSAVEEISIPEGVVSVGDQSFRSCTALKSIVLPDSISNIDGYAFYYCSALESITMPTGLESIGSYVFYGCNKLTEVHTNDIAAWCQVSFPYESNPTKFAKKLYIGDELVTELVIPEGVTTIGSYAFYYCKNLTSVTLPSTLTSIGDNAFYYCENIKTINIPEGVTSIGSYAFYYCRAIEEIKLPESLTSLSSGAFKYCTALTSINIPKNITTLEASVFEMCGFSSIEIPDNIVSIGYSAFYGCPLTTVKIPESVTIIDRYAFYDTSLTQVEIPSSVESIGESAFRSTPLTEITLPESVKSVGKYAFWNCDSLKKITLSYKLTNIGDYAFSANEGATIYGYTHSAAESYATANSIAFESLGETPRETIAEGTCGDAVNWTLDTYGLMKITGEGNMYDSSSVPWADYISAIKTVEIADGVTSIGSYSFQKCKNLSEISIPETVTKIGNDAFSSCTRLESISLPTGLTYMGYDVFEDCESLTKIVIPDGITSISSGLFSGCTKLSDVTFPSKLTTIWSSAFANCASLTELIIPEGVTTIESYAFEYCDNVTRVDIPSTLQIVGYGAFYGCQSIAEVNATDITAWCEISFGSYEANPTYYCGELLLNGEPLTEIDIPKGTTKIGKYAFSSCYNITKVTVPYTVLTIGSGAFPDGVEITGYDGSAAETYAQNYELTFVSLGAIPLETIAEGTCGDNATWELDSYGKLTISGSGSMQNYSYYGTNLPPWYDYKASLKNVVIENGITSIGSYAFYEFPSLETVEINYSVTNINYSAFYYCPDEMVIKGYDDSTAETYAINNDYTFESVGEIPLMDIASGTCGDSVNWVLNNRGLLTISGTGPMTDRSGWSSYSSSIKEVVIEEGVTSVTSSAFESCSYVAKVTLPETLTSIGSYAFQCYYLEELTIPVAVTSIGSSIVRSGVTIKGYSPSAAETYANDKGYTFESLGAAPVTTIASGSCGENVKWSLDNYGLLTISGTGEMNFDVVSGGFDAGGTDMGGADAGSVALMSDQYDVSWYSYRSSVKKVVIEEGVTNVAAYAFYKCSNLSEVTLPESITKIGYYAFASCGSLANITIHYNVTEIDSYAFNNTGVVITGYTGSAAEEYALSASKTFESLGEAPLAVLALGDVTETIKWTFDNRGLLTITGTGDMPQYTYNGPRPWDGYSSKIKKVEIIGVDRVYNYSFVRYNKLTSVVLTDVKTVDSYAFYYCNYITEATISPSVTALGSSAFGSSTLKVKGVKDTYAQMFADYKGFEFEAIEGDVGETEINTVYVSTVEELVNSIASNTTIILADGLYLLDKSAILGNEYSWEYADVLKIENVINLTIKAENPGKVEIVALQNNWLSYNSDKNALFYIAGGYNVVFEGIRMGQKTMRNNSGRVPNPDETELMGGYDDNALNGFYGAYIGTSSSSSGSSSYVPIGNNVTFRNCDIFNCTYAVNSYGGGYLCIDNCTIRDNVKGGIYATGETIITNSMFSRNGNSTDFKSTYCLVMNGTVSGSTFINNGNESFYSGTVEETGNVYSDNVWNGQTMKAYGVTRNGITWSVADENGQNTLKLGFDIERTDVTLKSATGEVYPYTTASLPWKEYDIDFVELNEGVTYNALTWGSCGESAIWQYNADTKTLAISGSGDMSDLGYVEEFYNYDIQNITIAKTITGVYNLFTGTAYYRNQDNWEDGCLYIGDVLVRANTDLTGEVVVKDGTRIIANEAFMSCSGITSVVLCDTVEHIGVTEKLGRGYSGSEGVFGYCKSLTSLTIPASVTEFDHAMVQSCSALKDIYYSGTKAQWKEIVVGDNNDALEYCTIHASDGTIEPPTFFYEVTDSGVVITSISPVAEEVVIPAEIDGVAVVEINSTIFMDMTALKSVTIEPAIKEAPYFTDCTNLEKVVFAGGVQYVYGIFEGCESLESITLGDSVVEMTTYGLADTAYYNNEENWDGGILYVDGYATLLAEDAPEKVVVRKDTKAICFNTFNNNSTVKEIVIPDGVVLQNIGETFYNMSALESVTLPDTFEIPTYGMYIYECEKLEAMHVSEKNPTYTSVDGVIFTKDMTSLVCFPMGRSGSYEIPDGVTTISRRAFADTQLTTLTIPASVNYIEDGAFPTSYYLSDIYYNITSAEWENLENIYIGNGNYAFNDASLHLLDYEFEAELVSYELSEDGEYYILTDVKDYAEKVEIPAEYDSLPVKEVDAYAFSGNVRLTEITVDENNDYLTSVDGVLFTKDMETLIAYPAGKTDESYTVPDGVVAIGEKAFAYSENLKSVDLGNVTTIGTRAFQESGITSVTIPDGVTQLGIGTFDTPNLEKIYFGTNVKSIERSTFYYQLKYIYFDGTQDEWNNVTNSWYVSSYTQVITKIKIEFAYATRTEEDAIAVELDPRGIGEDKRVVIIGMDEEQKQLIFDEVYGETLYAGPIVLEGDEGTIDQVKTVKIFVWESLQSMKPLCEPIEVEVH